MNELKEEIKTLTEALAVIRYYADYGHYSFDHSINNPDYNLNDYKTCLDNDEHYYDTSLVKGEPLLGRLAREFLSKHGGVE